MLSPMLLSLSVDVDNLIVNICEWNDLCIVISNIINDLRLGEFK